MSCDQNHTRDVQNSEMRYRHLFNHMMNGVAIYQAVDDGNDFVFLDLNRAGEAMDNVKREDVIGRRVTQVFPGVRDFGLFEIFKKVYADGKPRQHPVSFYKDRRLKAWRDNFVYRLPNGEVVSIYSDETPRRQAEDALQRRNQELARSNKDLEQFAYVASHDLQEPLRMVSSYAQLLARRYQGKLDADGDDFIEFIVDGAKRMRALIYDLLDYSRVTRQGNPMENVDLEKVLKTVGQSLQLYLEETGVQLSHDPMPIVVGDEIQLAQVFHNLLNNAIKFRSSVSPRAHIAVSEDEDEFIFSIKDNGIGIDPNYFKKIFEIFQRLHNKSDYPGTGIGLALCKKIVERHGGRIWVESQLEQGSTFYFSLPKKSNGNP